MQSALGDGGAGHGGLAVVRSILQVASQVAAFFDQRRDRVGQCDGLGCSLGLAKLAVSESRVECLTGGGALGEGCRRGIDVSGMVGIGRGGGHDLGESGERGVT